jgi:succinylglutamic semialdehyde dehydrogenase
MNAKFKLKGNFYAGNYHVLKLNPNYQNKIIIKKNPSNTEEILWELPLDPSPMNAIIESASKGHQLWRNVPLAQRIEYLRKYQTALSKREDEIARALSLETGKPLWEALQEAKGLSAKVEVTIKDSLPRIADQVFENIMPQVKGVAYSRPIGPSLIIGPFNFPCHLANGQIVNALIAGNSIIFKPSEKTAYAPELMMDALEEAGFPPGVVNLWQADGAMTAEMLKDKRIKGVFFTGSREVGKRIMQITHQDLGKMVALELGGKNTTIIDQNVPLDQIMSELVSACFLTAGQRCTSTSIIAIHHTKAEELCQTLTAWAKRIIVGDPFSTPAPLMGPLIDDHAVSLYETYFKEALEQGAKCILPLENLSQKINNQKGHFVSPSILFLEGPWQNKVFVGKEIFAPNTLIIPYFNEDEALAIANATDYGLAAAVFSSDESFIKRCLNEIDAGVINVNRSTVGASGRLPFGGLKDSGNYRPAAVTMIDACVHPIASLQMKLETLATDDKNKFVLRPMTGLRD